MDPLSTQPLAEHPGHDASLDSNQGSSVVDAASESSIDPAGLTEDAFLEYVLEQLRSDQWSLSVCLSDADLAAIEAESIGEHFSRYPFLY